VYNNRKLISDKTVELLSSSSSDKDDDADNEAFVHKIIPGPSSKYFKPTRGYDDFAPKTLQSCWTNVKSVTGMLYIFSLLLQKL